MPELIKTLYEFGGPHGAQVILPEAELLTKLGGKGFRLCTDACHGENVPAGFVVTTDVCREYYARGQDKEFIKKYVDSHVMPAVGRLITDGVVPLVSVRSGAPVSMPGMMETVLNVLLGTRAAKLQDWRKIIGTKTALDCMRRLVTQWAETVDGLSTDPFDEIYDKFKNSKSHTVKQHEDMVRDTLIQYKHVTGNGFPKDMREQLIGSICAVFNSWNTDRAITYRRLHNISDDMFTAVIIMEMKFGNAEGVSCSGVMFTRNPSTGEANLYGEYLPRAQGEDVVNGKFDARPISELPDIIYQQLADMAERMEDRYRDMQEIEFTVEGGKLWLLQSRTGKRENTAAIVIARDLVSDGVLDIADLDLVIGARNIMEAVSTRIAPDFQVVPNYCGIAACSGVVRGRVVLSSEDAIAMSSVEDVILVRPMTETTDFSGMVAAKGVLTEKGGLTCHASVVGRSLNKPCVVGAGKMEIYDGQIVTLDGSTGRVWVDVEVPTVVDSHAKHLADHLMWQLFTHHGIVERVMFDPKKGMEQWPLTDEVVVETKMIDDLHVTEIEGAMNDLAFQLGDRVAGGFFKKITLDLASGPAMQPEDVALWDALGATLPQAGSLKAEALKANAWAKVKGHVVLVGKASEVVSDFGFQCVTQVDDMNALLSAKGPINLGALFVNSFSSGNLEKFKKFLDVNDVSMYHPALSHPRTYALFDILGTKQ